MKRSTRMRRRFTSRRGSTILLAVGVLATLAIVALIYLANVGSERASATRVAQAAPYERASERVRDEIGALLAADLFGNKITTSDVPQYDDPANFQTRIWPRMFEDGEYSDYPFVDGDFATTMFNLNRPWDPPSSRAVLDPTGVGAPIATPSRDDAWLSTTEPFFVRNSPEDSYWAQISNIRDGYRWRADLGSVGRWVRADGRFADLGQWFLTNRAQSSGRGDSEADLAPDTILDFGIFVSPQRNSPERGLSQRVFGYQMNSLRELADGDSSFGGLNQADPNNGPRPFDRADGRFWADADGDLRPDSRWQTIDSLDGLFGLKWVAAARIIDNSALINVNTALDSGAPDVDILPTPVASSGLFLTDGRTPADVDLFRLLFLANEGPNQDASAPNGAWLDIAITGFTRNASEPSFFDIGPSSPGVPSLLSYRSAFREHLDRGLGLTSLINRAYERASGNAPYPFNSDLNWRFTREERAVAYRAFLADRGRGASADIGGRLYPISDELDLRTFWASNDDRTLSELERRLDFGYLPGQAGTRTSGPADLRGRLGGPLRAARPTSMERSLQQIERPGNSRRGRPTVQEVEDDVRHLLTTYSGASDASPVPVLNPAVVTVSGPMSGRPIYEGRYANRKIRVSDFPRGSVGATGPEFNRKADLIRRSFGAFTWALAPLATNEPLNPPLVRQDILDARNGATGRGHDYHYGGGSSSTAAPPNNGGNIGSPAYTFGQVSQALGGPNDLGASYAVLRAASLAVNLADAVDNEADPIPDVNTPTAEQPTVARLFNIPEIDPSSTGRLNSNTPDLSALDPQFQAGVIPMGVRFSHGDIAIPPASAAAPPTNQSDDVRMPARFVGRPSDGVTLIGLDRQPFLMEAWTLAYYDADPNGQADIEIDPTDPARQLGSIVAVEVGNPWPQPLDISGYIVRLQTPAGYVQMPLTGVIDVGHSRIIWGEVGRSASEWTPVRDEWTAIVQGQIASSVHFDSAAPATLELWLTGGTGPTTPVDPVIFQPIAQAPGQQTGMGVVTLWRTVSGVNALVDRLWKRNETTHVFPGTFQGNVQVTRPPALNLVPPETEWSGRIVCVTGVRRPTEHGSGAAEGSPAWVIERAENNVSRMEPSNTGSGGASIWYQSWWTDIPSPTVPPPEDLLRGIAIGYPTGGLQDLLGKAKEPFDHMNAAAQLPAFQLFVPNRPPSRDIGSPTQAEREETDRLGSLAATSELHMLCTFAHMYVHGDRSVDPLELAPRIDRAAVPTAIPQFFGMADPTTGGYWRTVSEQLGDPAETQYDGSGTSPPNPYLGTLDPSRYTLNYLGNTPPTGMASVANLPDALAAPLALRVFDAFEVLDIPGDLAQGRVNINTAPLKAIRMLPFVSPWYDVSVSTTYANSLADATSGGPSSPIAQLTDRAALISDYRDGLGEFSTLTGGQSRTGKLNYPGLRTVGEPPNAGLPALGFHYIGEVANLSLWHGGLQAAPLSGTVGAFTTGVQYSTFADLALAGALQPNAGVATTPTSPGVAEVDSVLDVRPSGSGGATARVYDPVNDAEQRLAIFRAISNIATTRSDVFTAWFVVRGYDPRRIEAIEIPAGANATERAQLLNHLEPTHESRWLAVFDRSNVRKPTDRPRVLLFTELPN